MIIKFDNLESTPIYHSNDYNLQHCIYNTSDDNSTYPINEITKFPSMQDIFKAIAYNKDCPVTNIEYSVFYKFVKDENEIIPLVNPIINFSISIEPYYNEITGEYDIWESYAHFKNIEDAYEFSINRSK
jgi:hypothetical protein